MKLLSSVLFSTILAIPLMAKPNPQPKVIPAVKEWKGAEGTVNIKNSQFLIAPNTPSEFRGVTELFLSSLDKSHAHKKDIAPGKIKVYFRQDKSIKNPEAYTLTISDKINISASSTKGALYGTRTLLQLMKQGDLPKGTIIDAPKYPVRSLLLDVGRKFIPVDGLKDWIRMMGYLKINELHLHLNDNSWGRYPGYRLESKKFPGLASKDGHYTFKQIRELQDFAKLHAVVIVPEIDSPGHSLAFTTYRPELAHKKINRHGFGIAYLDLTNPDAIKFMEDIWDEVCGIFDSELVHIGTDEYRLNLIKDKKERDALGESFRQYINHLNRYISKKHGKKVRTWSGYEHMPGTTEPDKSVIIDMWETADAKVKVKAGYKVVNSSHFYTYIVPGAPYYGVNNNFIYNTWTPMQFSGKPEGMLSPEDPGLMGGKLHIWNDYGPTGFTWNEIARLSLPSMTAMSEKLWGTKGAKDYNEFQTYSETLTRNIPHVKLMQRDAVSKSRGQEDLSKPVWSLEKPLELIPNSNPKLGVKGENLEYPWTANFTLTRHNDLKGNEILLSSELAAFYLDLTHSFEKDKKQVTKRGLACVRANQAPGFDPITSHNPDILVFDYQVPVGKEVKITFVGERRKTSLYVNGKFIQSINKQMVCPLTRIGDKLPRGIHATIHKASILSTAPKQTKIGSWSSGKITTTPTAKDIDITTDLNGAGGYEVAFQYTGGGHRLDIMKVEVLENGVVIHSDNQHGFTGANSSNNVYPFEIKKLKKGAKYTLRATIHSDGGTDSNGNITLKKSLR